MKTCCHCNTEKPKSEFYDEKRTKDGKSSWCRLCHNAHKKARRDTDPVYRAKEQAHCRDWFTRNKARVSETKKVYRAGNAARILFNSAKRRARAKNIEFNISLDDIVIPDICPLLGLKLYQGTVKNRDCSPSLDRIDNGKGYIRGNVWVISVLANQIKSSATLDQMKLIVANWEDYLSA